MIDINSNKYAENCVHTIEVIRKDNKSGLWIKIHDVQDNLGVKNMSDMTTNQLNQLNQLQQNRLENTKDMEKNLLTNVH